VTRNEIVVGVDDSPSAPAAIRWAAAYARSSGAKLRAIHVITRPDAHDGYAFPVVADYVYPDDKDIGDFYRLPSRRVFEEVRPEPDWTLQFAQGDAGRIVVGESREARLLVLGAREHRGFERILVGSVGHYCLNHSSCPLVSVPASDHKPANDVAQTADDHGEISPTMQSASQPPDDRRPGRRLAPIANTAQLAVKEAELWSLLNDPSVINGYPTALRRFARASAPLRIGRQESRGSLNAIASATSRLSLVTLFGSPREGALLVVHGLCRPLVRWHPNHHRHRRPRSSA
jgi:nucleotide-binding universal stress UspA family protein